MLGGMTMGKRLQFVARGNGSPKPRHDDQCIMLAERPAIAWLSRLTGNTAIVRTDAKPLIGSRIELHHPAAGMITGNVVERLKNGVAIAFNAGDRAITFSIARLARGVKSGDRGSQ
jgi:hypothetical protein